MAQVVERNVQALFDRQRQQEKLQIFEERLADRITRLTGGMLFVYLHLTAFTLWILINLGWLH